jgi:hypothetical protein
MIDSNCTQIRGMGVTIRRRSQLLQVAALATGLGVVLMMVATLTVVGS